MPNILPGFTWATSAARYRDTVTGKFVARTHINQLLANQIHGAEQRLGDIATAIAEKSVAPGVGQMLIRDELRRLHLQNAALGKGGMEKLDFRDYGRIGNALRDTYPRVANLAQGLADGSVSIEQAMQRVRGYAGEARTQFYRAERDSLRATGKTFEERRRLNPAEHCRDCVRWASMSWRPMGELPPPGQDSRCGLFCRCTMETREVTPEMLAERNTARLERMMA
jgi:hypothetical protein